MTLTFLKLGGLLNYYDRVAARSARFQMELGFNIWTGRGRKAPFATAKYPGLSMAPGAEGLRGPGRISETV